MSDQADGLRRMMRSLEAREGPPMAVAERGRATRLDSRQRKRNALARLFPVLAARFGRPESGPEIDSVDYSK